MKVFYFAEAGFSSITALTEEAEKTIFEKIKDGTIQTAEDCFNEVNPDDIEYEEGDLMQNEYQDNQIIVYDESEEVFVKKNPSFGLLVVWRDVEPILYRYHTEEEREKAREQFNDPQNTLVNLDNVTNNLVIN